MPPDKPAEYTSDASKDPSKRVRDAWSDEEHGRLMKLVAQQGARDWAAKAAALGTGRTGKAVECRYRRHAADPAPVDKPKERKRNAAEQPIPDADAVAAGARAAVSDQAVPQPTPGTAESAGTGTGGPEPDSGSSSSQGSSARPRKRGR